MFQFWKKAFSHAIKFFSENAKIKANFRHSTDREVALMVLMAYFSYITAEVSFLVNILHNFVCYFSFHTTLFFKL